MYKNEIKCEKIELICRCLNRLDHFSFLPTSLFMRGFFLHHLVKGISFDEYLSRFTANIDCEKGNFCIFLDRKIFC